MTAPRGACLRVMMRRRTVCFHTPGTADINPSVAYVVTWWPRKTAVSMPWMT